MKKPTRFEINKLLDKIVKSEGIKFETGAFELYMKTQGFDIRNSILDLYYLCANNINITIDNILKHTTNNNMKDLDIQLYNGINSVFYKDIACEELESIHDADTFLVPLLIHENYIKIMFHRKTDNLNKIKDIKNISKLCILYDIVNDKIFKNNYWSLIPCIPYMYLIPINKIFNKYKTICEEDTIEFPTLFTKMSQHLIKGRKEINLTMNIEKSMIKCNDIVYLLYVIEYYLFKKTNLEYLINNILSFYNINYEMFGEIIKLDKNISIQLKTPTRKIIKQIFMVE